MRRFFKGIFIILIIGMVYNAFQDQDSNDTSTASGDGLRQANTEIDSGESEASDSAHFEDLLVLFGEDWGFGQELQVDWYTTPDDLGPTFRVYDAERPHLRTYRRQDEQISAINDIAIGSIDYLYFGDKLVGVEVLPADPRSSSAENGLLAFLEELYGKGSSVSLFSLSRKWEGDQTAIRLDRPAFGDTLLTISHKARNANAEEHLAVLSKSERLGLLVDTLRQHAEPISYDDLARYYDAYQGRAVTYTGKIAQKARDDEWRVYIDGQPQLHVYVEYKGDQDPRLLEGDTIKFIGIAGGRYTYRSVLGSQITVPRISAYWVDRVP